MTINEMIGLRIKTMRLSRRMTQADLAKAIGQSPSSITMYESGKRNPDFETLEALADVFNVPLSAIVTNESRQKDPDDRLSQFLSSYNSLSSAGKDYIQQQLKVAQVMFSEHASDFNKEE